MPTYEYKCRECGHRFEVFQPFTAEPLSKCEECGGELGKVFGNIGITFKGSGFYRTDSRSSSTSTKANGKDKAPSKSESGDAPKSSDSKPAASTESKKSSSESGSTKAGAGSKGSSD